MNWREWGRFPQRSQPRAAKGGIRAQSKKGAFAQSWWAKRWIAVLESFNLGARLQRGRSYARKGQVLDIAVASGSVTAKVQGSRPRPYEVSIVVKPLSDRNWRKVAEVVSSQAIFGAKLLGGEMPQDIESAFQSAGIPLFPAKNSDLTTNCSCPDWSNPCKHIAAVYYLLGEEFDRDPFLIFQLRGMARDEFLQLLGESGTVAEPGQALLPGEPLPLTAALFWDGGPVPGDLAGIVPPSFAGAALPRRLGKLPFWRGQRDFLGELEGIYTSAAARATVVLGGG